MVSELRLNSGGFNNGGRILMIRPLPNVNQAYAMVVNVESQRKNNAALSDGIGDSTTLMSKANLGIGNNSFKPRNSLERPTLQCDYCHLKGYTKDTYYKLHGYPTDFKAKRRGYSGPQVNNAFTARGFQPFDLPQPTPQQTSQPTPQFSLALMFTQEQYDQILHMLNKGKRVESVANAATMNNTGTIKAFMSHLVNSNWIVDTGASNHMVHNSKLLSEIKDLTSIDHNKVHLPNGEQIATNHTGVSTIFRTKSLQNDLLSGKVMGIGKEECGLYILKLNLPEDSVQQQNAKPINNLASSINTISSLNKTVPPKSTKNCIVSLWHKRLGHAPMKVTSLLLLHGIIHQSFCSTHLSRMGERVSTAVYLLNRLPTVLLKGASPFEKLYGKVPSLQHLRVFGSLCYATSTSKTDKFSPRAIPAVHLGYSSVQKGYILDGLHLKLFFVSKATVFKEDVFPFKHNISGSSPLFPILNLLEADCSSPQYIPSPRTPTAESPSSVSSPSVDSTQLPSDLLPLSSPSPIAAPPHIRNSSRTSVPPIWLKDYVVPSKGAVCNYSIFQYVCYDKLSPAYQACIAAYSAVSEPTSHAEASIDP
ncbi:PREDICTED: uncharacterized protein LOC109211918 [Nicotiana attenuata]|uniref:uncharacterized protein LOC109211918 n=1 Tax=Nicotiana attenuata TaxID=49451 RepID=UPI000905666C|nr:PREDICTED: uncharacterized protein LOC109211918 [Nicotiana attenuata]